MPGDAGQADCIMLLSLDKETKEGRILQINRNTMTQIDTYDSTGSAFGTVNAQLATQYAYCIGGSPKLSETHGDPRRTTPKQSETYGAPRPPLRYRSDSGGDYYLPNKHSIQINSYL